MTAAFMPADEPVREAIRNRLDENMCVEAGAGTGKTSVLVDRIINVLRTGRARVEELAVITFTEKAAAELAARVRQGLDEALDAPATGREERGRIEAAMRGLNRAHIETIHAFAAGLLRERPVEARLDPGFEVLEELPAQLAFESAYGDWLAQEMAAETVPAALVDALEAGLDIKQVREAAEILHRYRDLLPLPPRTRRPFDTEATLDAVLAEVAAVRGHRPRDGHKDGDEVYAALVELCETLDGIEGLRGKTQALRRALVTLEVGRGNRGRQEHWPAEQRKAVRDALAKVREIVDEARLAVRSEAVGALLEWLQGFVAYYGGRRLAEGKADFEDLLIRARDLLRDNLEVRRYFQSKYRCVLVDEFQDTDPLQVELIVFLCEDGAAARDWRDVRLRPGSLFVVGDPKQSIYRFRRADIATYDAVKARLFEGKVLDIVQNFRSVRPVVELVNRTFERMFTEETGVQPRYTGIEPRPDLPATAGVVRLRGTVGMRSAQWGFSAEQRRAEAEAIAALLRQRIEGGEWHVRLEDGSGTRAARYRDVAVLVPTRTELQTYEDALARAGVPHRHEGGRQFFQRQEVRELIAVLRAIDDPADGVAAVAALRSPAFGCSDEELLAWRTAGRGFDHDRIAPEATGAVAHALRSLHGLAVRRQVTPLPELVRAVLDETRLVEFAMLQPQGEQRAANLLKTIDQARAFARAGGGGLRSFVRWLKLNMARETDETDAAISEETDDVVRVLTVHAAKGLEFPIVVLANTVTPRDERTSVIAERGERRLQVKLGKLADHFHTPGFVESAALAKQHAAAEDQRLLYVATTRARDLLVLPFFLGEDHAGGGRTGDEPRSLLERLVRAGAHEGEAIDAATLPPLDAEPPLWRTPGTEAAEEDVRRAIDEREQWAGRRGRVLDAAAEAARIVTASALKPEWERPSAAGEDVRRGRAADFGSAVHAVLERIDLARPEDAMALAQAAADELGLPGHAAEVARVARSALGSAAVARAQRSRRVLREAPFTVAVPADGGALAEGRIDLLFEEDGALVIVDFKTDDVRGEAIDGRAAMYRNQALVYAWAARAATGLPVREVVFVFARAGEERRYACDAAFMAEAEELVRRAAQGAGEAVAP